MGSALLHLAVMVVYAACHVPRAASSISWPFSARAGLSLSGSSSINPLLNSTNAKFLWGWVPTSNNKFLLSIVYMPVSTMDASQVVWSANRNHPVNENASLQLLADGNLVLNDTDGALVWSSTNSTSGAVTLTLQNQGNLVLLNPRGDVVWQSFDHPCDILLPGQVIATGTQVIASASFSDVSEGVYSISIEQGGLIMYVAPRGSDPYLPYHVVGFSPNYTNNTVESVQHPTCKGTTMEYSRGGGDFIFRQSGAPGCNQSFSIPIGFNDNNTNIILRLDPDGNVRTYVYRVQYGWGMDQELFSASLYCDLPGKCGDYGVCSSYGSCSCPLLNVSGNNDLFYVKNPSDPTSGCALSHPPTCSQDKGTNHFVELQGVNYIANDFTYQSSSDLEHCKSACALSCNCSIAFYQQKSRSCFHYQFVMSIQTVADTSFLAYIKVGQSTNSSSSTSVTNSAPPAGDGNGHSQSKMVRITAIISAIIVLICLVSCTMLGMKIRKRLAEMHADDAFLESLPGLPTRFSFRELNKATEGFSKRLGSGGFGSVYEGNLVDGTRVAVKRLEGARQGWKEFHAEVAALGSINHLNLVRLRGFCTEKSQCLLVYDHVTHGSLDKWLFSDSKVLNWPTRYNIALETARGLAFLHEESRERIVHLDVKPQNILLDVNFVAKLSDFGLSKLIDRGESELVTTMRGTPGYVAPEWLRQVAVTSKSDVYSYGMVLLELVSGQRNLDMSRDASRYFPAWAVLMVEHGKMMEIVDERLVDGEMTCADMASEAERMIKVAMWCIQEDPSQRPCMSMVVRMLEGHADVEAPPSLLEFAMRTRSASSSIQVNDTPSSYNADATTSSAEISQARLSEFSMLSGPR